MISKGWGVFLLVLAMGASVFADEIILKEGKSISGVITQENDKEITVNLGPNMYLRIAKEKILKITREKPEKPSPVRVIRPRPLPSTGNKVSTSTVTSSTSAVSTSPITSSTPVASTQSIKALLPPVLNFPNVVPGKKTAFLQKERSSIHVTFITSTTTLTASNFKNAMEAIKDPVSGKGFLEEGKRHPYKIVWSSIWTGEAKKGPTTVWNSVVVHSTITRQALYWVSPKKLDPLDVQKWKSFVEDLEKDNAAINQIYERSLLSFAEAMNQLQSKDESSLRQESDSLFKSMFLNAEKRRNGYERRKEQQQRKNTHP